MHLRNLDSHGHTAVSRDQQELAARCALEEASLSFCETERTLHSRRFRGAVTPEQHHRAIRRDHAPFVRSEEVLRVLRRHHERRAVFATPSRQLDEEVAQGAVCAERTNFVEHDVAAPTIVAHQLPKPSRDDERGGGHVLRRHLAQRDRADA